MKLVRQTASAGAFAALIIALFIAPGAYAAAMLT